jgi:hypothetical protein
MKAAQMAECLRKIAPLLEEGEAAKLTSLSEIVAQEGDKTFGSFCAKVEKALSAGGPTPSDSDAAEIMMRMGGIALAAGAGPLSKDFIAAGRIIRALGDTDAAEIQTAVAKALAPPPKKQRPPKSAPMEPRAAADQLTALSQDSSRFEAFLDEVAKLPKPKFAKVAECFLGFSRVYSSKKEITEAIRARHLQDAIDAKRAASGVNIAI